MFTSGTGKDLWLWKGIVGANHDSVPKNHTGGLLTNDIHQEICSDGYWNRVWIVQEVGNARKIQVGFGEIELPWNTFMAKITAYPFSKGYQSPMKLHSLREEKYEGSHEFLKLLETHQQALCKDPRDKIYGFVGLATDARKFPMDYQKSCFDVWKDTMRFANTSAELLGPDVISKARLIKSLLGDSNLATASEIAREYMLRTGLPLEVDERLKVPSIFWLRTRVVGYINYLGPSLTRVLSVLDSVDIWRERIQQNFKGDLSSANRDSDDLLGSVLDGTVVEKDTLSFPCPQVIWYPKSDIEELNLGQRCQQMSENKQQKFSETCSGVQIKPSNPDDFESLEPCLFQMGSMTGCKSPWRMGVAAEGARCGDLICWIEEVDKTVIVRVDEDHSMRIIGTAVVKQGQVQPIRRKRNPHSSSAM